MPADRVEGERRAARIHRDDVTIGHEPELDERLKAVANAQHEAITIVEQTTHGIRDVGIAEERRDELGTAIRLVATGKTTGNHDDLAVVDLLDEGLRALCDRVRRQVVDDEGLGHGAGALEGERRIVLAIITRKDRNDDARLGEVATVRERDVARVADHVDATAILAIREHILELVFPCFLQHGKAHGLASGDDRILVDGLAKLDHVHVLRRFRKLRSGRHLDGERSVRVDEQRIEVDLVVDAQADTVAQTHLEKQFGVSAKARRANREHLTGVDETLNRVEAFE